jgi:hypothetical protein
MHDDEKGMRKQGQGDVLMLPSHFDVFESGAHSIRAVDGGYWTFICSGAFDSVSTRKA